MSKCESGFSSRTVILSVLVGAIAGVGAMLLLAPKTRRESSARIRGLSRDLSERASASYDTARRGVSSTVSRGLDFVDDTRSAISSAVAPTARVDHQSSAQAAPEAAHAAM